MRFPSHPKIAAHGLIFYGRAADELVTDVIAFKSPLSYRPVLLHRRTSFVVSNALHDSSEYRADYGR